MATKLNKKFALVMLLGALGLTACNDEIKAYPQAGAILPTAQGQDIYNNELESIYEAIRSGSLPSDVLDKLLYEYANTIFGRYTSYAPSYRSGANEEKTLSEVATSTDASVKEEFIRNHKAYWVSDKAPEGSEMEEAKAKLDAIYDSIEDRIAEALYKQISSGTYSVHNMFYEEKFLAALKFDGKHVKDFQAAGAVFKAPQLLRPEVEAKDVFDADKGFLTKENYYSADIHYAVEENIESIYKQLLTEQYIMDESYSAIGRAYARKVNVLSIKVDSANPLDVPALANYLVNNIITVKDGENYRFGDEQKVKDLYASVSKIMRGLPKYFSGTEKDEVAYNAVDYLNDNYGLYGDPDTVEAAPLTSTEYGAMQKEVAKINDNLSLTDTSIESSYTGSGAYTVEQGKIYKAREIELKNYTTSGWFIKNGGLSSLPEAIRSKLFNHAVAVALNKTGSDALVDRTDVATWNEDAYDSEAQKSKYVAKVNGAYFLKSDTIEDKSSNKDLYFYDSSSQTYYFVQIVKAVNSAMLVLQDNATDAERSEIAEITREVCKVVGESSTYESLAKEHWLEKMALEYHDQAVYDYFKSNFPKLFDDED